MNILSTFRDSALQPHDFEVVLQRIARLIPVLAQRDERLAYENWRLKGDTLQGRYCIQGSTIEVSPEGYAAKQVFPDKPGVGWMLYVPRVLKTQQVPEAQALIPVLEARKQIGTIVVSVDDEVFSSDNPQHVETANRIEIRLVSDDLLPRYTDI